MVIFGVRRHGSDLDYPGSTYCKFSHNISAVIAVLVAGVFFPVETQLKRPCQEIRPVAVVVGRQLGTQAGALLD